MNFGSKVRKNVTLVRSRFYSKRVDRASNGLGRPGCKTSTKTIVFQSHIPYNDD